MKNQHQHKCRVWQTFLQEKIPNDTRNRLAFVEIGRSKRKGIRPEQSIYGAVREACALEGISSQMIQTINSTESSLKRNDPPYRVLQAALDLTLRQLGILYGQPLEVYKKAGIPTQIAQSLDIIALCRLQEQSQDVHYAIAVRLQATGLVEVMLPSVREWIPYHQAGVAIGKIFSQARGDDKKNYGKRIGSNIKLKGAELVEFAAYITTQKLERPTIIFIEADVWRNERGQDNDSKIWPQLKNDQLHNKRDILDFSHVFGHNCKYQRNDAELNNLLAVIRLRSGQETPQYIPDRETWNDDTSPRDFQHLVGFYDDSTSNMLHYFSIGRLPKTQKQQATGKFDLYMLDEHDDGESGAAIAFKHQQILEMVPFFIHPDFQSTENTLSLCRCIHYLRTSPAWSMGNISRPYPMHLGHVLIKDQICILGY
ncbi:MAG: RNAseH domain-containing protein [Symploca sp. SIO2B6]|nr:RNAseH domain-containing protein [Symploca sp. SIO2B6]